MSDNELLARLVHDLVAEADRLRAERDAWVRTADLLTEERDRLLDAIKGTGQ